MAVDPQRNATDAYAVTSERTDRSTARRDSRDPGETRDAEATG